MPVAEAVDIVRQVCRGLALAHSKSPPIIHRDIKPQNILVGIEAAGVRIRGGDFGLARAVNPLTRAATARGTPAFKPPEVFEGHPDSPASDVWSVGVTFYLLLTGKWAFAPSDETGLSDRRRFERPLPPASIYNIGVDKELDAILARCLDRSVARGRRFADAVELLERLEAWSPSDDPDPGPVPLEELVAQAFKHVREGGDLETAADLLERAINHKPALAARYAQRLALWRSGVIM
jgi:serine/threonine-protein kinase